MTSRFFSINQLSLPFKIGSLCLPNRLIQGPLAGYSCAPFRQLCYEFVAPSFCVSEMISAQDVINKHQPTSRYLVRAPQEKILCYQLAGNNPSIMAMAAHRLEALGADVIDINCGCPKNKIRKKGAGSALLESPDRLLEIVHAVRESIQIPLTVKIRLLGDEGETELAKRLEQAGVDALIVHGRRWQDDYSVACNYKKIARIKQSITIPVITNGDIYDSNSLLSALENSGGDAFMISRAGCGQPWLFESLLTGVDLHSIAWKKMGFIRHLQGLASIEGERAAVMQSRSLFRYYFREARTNSTLLQQFYQLSSLLSIEKLIHSYGI